MDGRDEATSLCGVTIKDNTAGAIGGGFFRVSNDHTGSFAMDRSTVDGNRVTPTERRQRGRAVSRGPGARDHGEHDLAQPGLLQRWHLDQHVHRADDQRHDRREHRVRQQRRRHVARSHADRHAASTARSRTITRPPTARSRAAIFGDGLTLVNTIVANNTAMYTPTLRRRAAPTAAATCSGRTARCAPRLRSSPIRCSASSPTTAGRPRRSSPRAGSPAAAPRHRLSADRPARQPARPNRARPARSIN